MLKTDAIILSVTASTDNRHTFLCNPQNLRFEHELGMVVLTVGQKSEWTLPKVLNAYMNSYDIVYKPDPGLVRYLTFNIDSNTMLYNDLHGSNQLVGNFFKV